MKYRSLSDYLKEEFGEKIYKLSLQSGCSCPNRDGRIGTGGCTFCSEGGSGDFAAPLSPIPEQIRLARQRVEQKLPQGVPHHFMAYFQSYTNTYGDPDRLYQLFQETIDQPEICALSIGTRPDCISDRMLEKLKLLNAQKPVFVELGLQTIHERTAEHIHRGYPLPVFLDSYQRLKAAGLKVVVHVILGLPGESEKDMLETVSYLAGLDPVLDGIKLQLLHILKGTALASEYRADPFPVFDLENYTDLVIRCLKLLPPETVVHRITGDGPKSLLIAPLWSQDKKRVLNYMRKKIEEA